MILQNATNQELVALQFLNGPQGVALLNRLRSELEGTHAQLVKADEMARIYRLQGRAAVLQEILNAAEKAHDLLTRA